MDLSNTVFATDTSNDWTSTFGSDGGTPASDAGSGSSGGFWNSLGSGLSSVFSTVKDIAPTATSLYSSIKGTASNNGLTAQQIAALKLNGTGTGTSASGMQKFLPWIIGGAVALVLIVVLALAFRRK